MDDKVYVLKNYGKININLKTILESKGISRSKLCNISAVSYDIVNRYYNNKVIRVDLDVISRLCFVLDCSVSDILQYEKK